MGTQQGKAPPNLIEFEMRFVDCPGDVKRVVRGDKDFALCAGELKKGATVPASIDFSYDRERENYWRALRQEARGPAARKVPVATPTLRRINGSRGVRPRSRARRTGTHRALAHLVGAGFIAGTAAAAGFAAGSALGVGLVAGSLFGFITGSLATGGFGSLPVASLPALGGGIRPS